jgi:hypothetical protein
VRVPRGRIAELYNPEMFQEHEEVIIFTRDEFSRFYNSNVSMDDIVPMVCLNSLINYSSL